MKTCDQLARREDQAAERIEQQEGELMRIRAASLEVVPNLAPPVRRHQQPLVRTTDQTMAASYQFSKRIPEGGSFESHWRLHHKRGNSALYFIAVFLWLAVK